MSTPPQDARIVGFVAERANVAVLLRTGPSKKTLMIRWDLDTDEFSLGQWLNYTVKHERSGLSEDGKLFAYYALDYRRKSQSEAGPHVAISRPPYFSALALWWAGGMHTGGAQWIGPREIGLCEDVVGHPDKGSLPSGLVVSSLGFPSMQWWHQASMKISKDRALLKGLPLRILNLGFYHLGGSTSTPTGRTSITGAAFSSPVKAKSTYETTTGKGS